MGPRAKPANSICEFSIMKRARDAAGMASYTSNGFLP
jgi:hypothetical protein